MTSGRYYDVIVFGDEVPGVLAAISAAREYRRRTSRYPSVLLMSKNSEHEGLGGHLVRGKLAYLDRSQISPKIRKQHNLDTFGDPPALYQEFLREAGVHKIALNPDSANDALQRMRRQAGVDLLTGVRIDSVFKQGRTIAGIQLKRGEAYFANQFIDATVNAELAQAAGAGKVPGFGTFGLPDSELSVTLVFETEGLSSSRLKQIEEIYLRRFTDRSDTDAQSWLQIAADGDPKLAKRLSRDMKDSREQLKGLYEGDDYIDVRSPALSVAYHAFRGKPFSLAASGSLLDKANIAKLPGNRLIWNALLFDVNASQAEELARNLSLPNDAMLEEMSFVAQWFKSLGATAVKPASELYIRHAGNITNPVSPLSGSKMLKGGVPRGQALATFGYHFDIRGGIKGLGNKAAQKGFADIQFAKPIFNVGIEHALLRDVPNLAVVSPASGFEGFAASAGRIVEHNAGVAQGLGIAAIIALLDARDDLNLANVSNAEVQEVLEATNQLPKIYGVTQADEAIKLDQFETALVIRQPGVFA